VARREARVGDTVATLTDREFRVLQFLMMNVGEVISRQRLLSEVWGYDFDPRSNVVDVCIRRLRRRLGPDAPIETVPQRRIPGRRLRCQSDCDATA
jgi:DNA-binding response OmpR family regulator